MGGSKRVKVRGKGKGETKGGRGKGGEERGKCK